MLLYNGDGLECFNFLEFKEEVSSILFATEFLSVVIIGKLGRVVALSVDSSSTLNVIDTRLPRGESEQVRQHYNNYSK